MRTGRGTFQIVIGLIMIAILLVLALFGPALAPYPRDYSEKIYEQVTDEGVEVLYSPQPPSLRHPMGTDRWGFDILSLLFFGARYTVFGALGVALARVLIGGGLGLLSGIRKGLARPSRLAGVLGAIPSFVIVYFVMAGINVNSPYSPLTLTIIQGIVMTIIGIPTVAAVVRDKSVRLRNSDHVSAAVALGADRPRIARRHILPLLREDLMVLVVHEVVIVLTLLGQLAIFDMFLGGTVRWEDPVVYVPLTHEWAGLIGYARPAVQVYQWILLSPLVAFLFAVFAFQMLATGLEHRMRTEYVKTPHV
jgi:peptide/nickel transport system permease protein